MADAMEAALRHLGARDQAQMEADEKTRDAIVLQLHTLGDAARRVPADVQAAHPEIPWAAMIGMRNRLVHGYDTVSYAIVWRVVNDQLRKLAPIARALQAKLAKEGR
ncbi:MAG: DUF86 domain-containing protein [Euryarchaeota archaeon]|nr:DUF86 domain-containing protein [Euryarchaeota archaeon]